MDLVLTTADDLRSLVRTEMSDLLSSVVGNESQAKTDKREWLTNKEARDFLGSSKSTLQRYRAQGIIPFSKVGGNIYYRRADIVDLLERNLRMPSVQVVA